MFVFSWVLLESANFFEALLWCWRFVFCDLSCRGGHVQDQDWISCRILAIISDQDWLWIPFLKKNGSGQDPDIGLISITKLSWEWFKIRGEHGQDQDWMSCRILAIFLDQDWIWIFSFEKNWIRTWWGYWFDFYNEIFLRVIQDVTNDCAVVFFAIIL